LSDQDFVSGSRVPDVPKIVIWPALGPSLTIWAWSLVPSNLFLS